MMLSSLKLGSTPLHRPSIEENTRSNNIKSCVNCGKVVSFSCSCCKSQSDIYYSMISSYSATASLSSGSAGCFR